MTTIEEWDEDAQEWVFFIRQGEEAPILTDNEYLSACRRAFGVTIGGRVRHFRLAAKWPRFLGPTSGLMNPRPSGVAAAGLAPAGAGPEE